MGGSILSGLNNFRNMWITKHDWDEHGENILKKKTFWFLKYLYQSSMPIFHYKKKDVIAWNLILVFAIYVLIMKVLTPGKEGHIYNK